MPRSSGEREPLNATTLMKRITWAVVGIVLATALNVALSGNAIFQGSRLTKIEKVNSTQTSAIQNNRVLVNVITARLSDIQENIADIKATIRRAK